MFGLFGGFPLLFLPGSLEGCFFLLLCSDGICLFVDGLLDVGANFDCAEVLRWCVDDLLLRVTTFVLAFALEVGLD